MGLLGFCLERISLYLFSSVWLLRMPTPFYALVFIYHSKTCHTNRLNTYQMAQLSPVDVPSFVNHQQEMEYKCNNLKEVLRLHNFRVTFKRTSCLKE